jgi:hypothetical protein
MESMMKPPSRNESGYSGKASCDPLPLTLAGYRM